VQAQRSAHRERNETELACCPERSGV